MVNGRVIDDINVKMLDSAKVRYATFFNKLRCMVNTDVVDAHLSKYHKGCTATNIAKSAIVIKATTKWGCRKRVPLSCDQRKVLFEQCPESTSRIKIVADAIHCCACWMDAIKGLFETWSDTTTHWLLGEFSLC
jgi:hypothetical protein